MIQFGVERETTELDDNGSTITIIRKVRNQEVMKTYRHIRNRVKVKDSKSEMAEYIKHTDKIREKKEAGLLVISDRDDPTLVPAFVVEYPKFDDDGSYFIISCWTELVQ